MPTGNPLFVDTRACPAMAPPPISPAYLASDALFEQEVLKLSAAESEDDLNRRLVQSAEDVGMSEHEIAQCLGPHFMPMALHTAPSSVSTAIHSPNSRGSFNTGSTAPTSSHSILSDEPRPSMHGAAHRKNISISSLFGARGGRDMPQPSLDSIPVTLPEVPNSSLKAKAQFLVRDVEINILNGKGLRKFSKGFSVFRKGSGNEPVPWQPEPSPHDPVKYSTGGIHAGLAGRIELKDQHRPMIIEARMPPGRPPSVNTEAGDRRGFRSRSGAIMRKKTNRKSIPDPTELHGVHSWSSTDLADNDSGFHFTPMSTMRDEGDADDASIPLQAMLASSPWAEPEPIRQEMKDAMKTRSYLMVQAANRNELRRLRAFRNKQVRALQ
ncbi:MAG: hypothetical protein INR71_09540, partial [Terriglobus roseus]|nr:hypothetical protein [Terriglobus roseus]